MIPDAVTAAPLTRRATVIRYVVPGVPWILAVLIALVSPTYFHPLLTNAFGIGSLIFLVAMSVGGWLTFPPLASVTPRWAAYGLGCLWAGFFTIPGIVIVLMAPAIIVVSRALNEGAVPP